MVVNITSAAIEPSKSDLEPTRAAATQLLVMADELAAAIVDHIGSEMPEFGRLDGTFTTEFRRAVAANLNEIGSLLRAGVPLGFAAPVGSLAYADAMRRRGVGLRSLVRSYQLAVAVFRPVIEAELQHVPADAQTR